MAGAKAKGKKVWVSREVGSQPDVTLWEKKPTELLEGGFAGFREITTLSYPLFRLATGFILQPGEMKKVRFSVKETR